MIKKIEQTIKKYHLLEEGDKVVVALSGGPDSCALLVSLIGFVNAWRLKLVVAHFNHGLRQSQSDEDEVFCRSLAQKFNLPFVTEQMPQAAIPKGLSPEEYFRKERYLFLDKIAANHGAKKIALGHHLKDQAETVLLNILRGSGLDGLKGFLPMRESKYIRPLMEITRQEINNFLKKTGVEYREDNSNKSTVYLRNHIRRELIPYLKEKYNPRIEQNLARMAEIIRRDDEFINEFISKIMQSPYIQKKNNEVSFSAEYFKTLHVSLGYRLLKALLENLASDGKGFSSYHLQSIFDLTYGNKSQGKIALPYGLHGKKEYDRIVIKFGPIEKTKDYEYPMIIPGNIDIQERHIILCMRRATVNEIDFTCVHRAYFDEDKIKTPLVVRNRRKGDWFEPLGTRGSQKIKKLFIDRKIPGGQRDSLALIADQESVIWIENMHQSDRVKVTPETKNVLVLDIQPLAGGLKPV